MMKFVVCSVKGRIFKVLRSRKSKNAETVPDRRLDEESDEKSKSHGACDINNELVVIQVGSSVSDLFKITVTVCYSIHF